MKTKHLLLLGIIVVFSSCSAVYRTSQTPDDVYYSSAPPQNDYVQTDNQQDRDSYGYNNSNSFNSEDLAIRRGIREPIYRNSLSFSLGYGYDPYNSFDYGYNSYNYYDPNGYNNPYSYPGVSFYPYSHNYNYYGGCYSSPFYNYYQPPFYIPQPGTGVTLGPRKYNLGVYSPTVSPVNNHPGQSTTTNSVPVRTFTTKPANTTGVGSFIRRVFTPNNNSNNSSNRDYSNSNNNNNNSSSTRSFGSGGGSSSSGGGSAPARTFRK